MKILQFECVGGASGDMILGALSELGADLQAIERELSALKIGPFKIEARPFQHENLHGTQASVHLTPSEPHPPQEHPGHRNLNDIERMIQNSTLPAPVKETSLRVFRRLGEAEARVHGTTVDQVHFHEVGALDSIIDIIGSCLGLHQLRVDEVVVGPFPTGTGIIECAHGRFPNPAPATLELLKGQPLTATSESCELVTPTGAALLTTWKTREVPPTGSRIVKLGYSFGHFKLEHRPNLLRALLLEFSGEGQEDECRVLECNLDDTTPELLGSLVQRLMEAGALDAFITAVQMKKQRPGSLLTVLCKPETRDSLLDLIFRESTTFGIREYSARRTILDRRFEEVETPFGRVKIKIGRWKGRDVTWAPEMEDCIRLAKAGQVPVRSIYEAAASAANRLRPSR